MSIDRRAILLAMAAVASPNMANAQSSRSAFAFSFEALRGGALDLSAHAGQVLLVVNTASRCGFTNQYTDLQNLWDRFRSHGLVVVGVPSDDFNQERGSNAEIAEFCQSVFGVTFPMAAKQRVTGAEAHPFYRWAAAERPADTPRWNFHKYLIDRRGRLVAAFPSRTRPTDPRVIAAIEAQLAVS